jgi:hypothetical protein
LKPLSRMSVLELVARHVRGRVVPRANTGSA